MTIDKTIYDLIFPQGVAKWFDIIRRDKVELQSILASAKKSCYYGYIVISFLGHYSTKTEMGNYFIF